MQGLVAYDSSSEDEETKTSLQSKGTEKPDGAPAQIDHDPGKDRVSDASVQNQLHLNYFAREPPRGPVLGPASGPAPLDRAQSPDGQPHSGRASPFSTSRTLIHDLTLPPIPNLDIPPSPPGSPDPAANAKFEHFLSLKKQGVHFNSKLASSSSLKNPSLLVKMMEHAGIDEQSQYKTSLSSDLWATTNLPRWGFKEELRKTQQVARQKLEEIKSSGQRSSIDFVSGSGADMKRRANP
ncbi:hypothetical protein N7532_010410 [Penicillium argentinense]|uniref:HCNGP-like protein n=1 Tax=Penicillium argentinense TaxID=1131581 RepID=A0A9W9EPP8_9EURO|nr:uncharacterized protein N7532_010410 [Penicillium argentinense]KAJ5085639.1 hypothetical protein N7532_010410 [Penicillium argentinense]